MLKSAVYNIRFYVLVVSFLLSIVENVAVQVFIQDKNEQISVLVPLFAYTAIFYLYITLLAGPATKLFLWLPFRGAYIKARRALGVSVLYFSLLHAGFAFFIYLGGFSALFSINALYLFGLSLGAVSLCIFLVMGLTSSDTMVRLLTFPVWKFIHRFVYLAGILILIHALLIGEFYIVFPWVRVFLFVAVAFLVGLHGVGLWKKYHVVQQRQGGV